jgi:hypothetical protein
LSQKDSPQIAHNQEKLKVNRQEHLISGSTKNPKIEDLSHEFLIEDHQEKSYQVLICESFNKNIEETPQIRPTKIAQKYL